MKKLRVFTFLILLALTLCNLCNGYFAVKVNAETVTGAKLEYFELTKPVCVAREGDVVYIAEKELIVIYHNDTYNKIPLEGFDIEYIAKCGNHLLVLSKNTLYSLNLATLEFAPLTFSENNEVDFSTVTSFAVNGERFAIATQNRRLFIFEVTDKENFLFTLASSSDLTLDQSNYLAINENLGVYYYSPSQSSLHFLDGNTGMQGPYKKFSLVSVDCFAYSETFYYKSSDVIYSLGQNLLNDLPVAVVNLKDLGIENSGDFFISGDKILICDTEKDRILEYDLTAKELTGFEISFTKIDLPQDFAITLNKTPNYVTVAEGVRLYDINLANSQKQGYFAFNGYYTQEQVSEYLVISEISNAYYLIAGEVVALVLKEDFTPAQLEQTAVNKSAYLTTDATTYLHPRLTPEFTSFKVEKSAQVEVISTLKVAGVDYSLISSNGNLSYIPSSFLIGSLQTTPEFFPFETATTTNKEIIVYQDEFCKTEQGVLAPHSVIIISQKGEYVYQIIYDGKVGYINKWDIEKRGWFTNKIVAVVLMLAFALLCTVIHFEIKYLYTKKKPISPPKHK